MSAPPLAKLDVLAKRLLEGAQLKTHKYFRIAVPHALTGQSLVALVAEKGYAEDEAEAVHMASLLLQHGYLFPVIEHASTVRDDGTLYRLQRPYFWPSHATHTDNVEYAIYLNKRLLRNEQKNTVLKRKKLAELLAHMWGFITQQAEMQLKHQKEKKKADKVVYDSEERAFWRMRKPGASNSLEEHVGKTERKIRKPTTQAYRNLVDRLKFSLKTKPWLKALKASDTMVTWVDQRVDYDPFLTAPQPSNPWLTDDTGFWTLNTDTVEIPTERRVKRWGLSVQELVKDPIGRQVLETFLESDRTDPGRVPGSGAPAQVNVDSRTLDQTLDCLRKATTPSQRRHAFYHSEEHVFTLMAKDSYPRFVRSQIYKGVLSAAQQQGTRRLGWRNFVFNMGVTKKPLGSKQQKAVREEAAAALPKQLSSDSLPVRQAHAVKIDPE
ncbi:unnamed protein product [Caenorhabditis auriculariae]|uniref:RGS domain-containing protein n=1 Tax=Caenorhabditis auriculariae TaxID=2777116 RepID=A0A8S1HUI1_9PELO|nr:unnamed protein product [Caenorhabditis auriculariae]